MGANSSRPDDLIGPDIDPVGDHDDLMSMSTESADSGVSLKSDQSKAGMILFEDSSPLSSEQQQRPHSAGTMESDQMESRMSMRSLFDMLLRSYTYYSSPRLMDFDSDVSAVEVLKRIADDLMAARSTESNYTDVSMRSDFFNPITSRSPPSRLDFSSSEKKPDVTYVEEWIKSLDEQPDDLIGPDIDPVGDHDVLMATRSLESIHSDVSLKRDQSKGELIDFKDRVSPSMATRRPESIHSGVSLKSDWSKAEPFDFKDRVSPSSIITVTITLAVAGLFISARCVR